MKRHELTEEQWNKVKDLLPPEKPAHGGRPGKDNRVMLNGILYWLNTGIPWRDLPERYGPWKSVYTRFRRWSLQGVWEHVFEELITQDIVDESTLMLDSTTVKVHQHGSGAKKGRRSPRTQPGRIKYESPCGSGRAVKPTAASVVSGDSQ